MLLPVQLNIATEFCNSFQISATPLEINSEECHPQTVQFWFLNHSNNIEWKLDEIGNIQITKRKQSLLVSGKIQITDKSSIFWMHSSFLSMLNRNSRPHSNAGQMSERELEYIVYIQYRRHTRYLFSWYSGRSFASCLYRLVIICYCHIAYI